MMKSRLLVLLLALLTMACTKHTEKAEIDLNIGYIINGKPLVTDTLCYENEAGNRFLITEIQWFLSNIQLLGQDGEWHTLKHLDAMDPSAVETEHIFYIDTDIPESHTLRGQKMPIGHYSMLRFTFGLDENNNQTGIFNDSPESEMFWPDMLGGGYHYMKLNGKFVGSEGRLNPLAIHLGIGQNADHSEYYQNYFTIEGPIDLNIAGNKENLILLCMIVDNWFRSPNLYDFNVYGSAIMQNQAAQQALKENGQDVFIWSVFEEPNEKDMKKDEIVEGFNRFMQQAAPKPHYWRWENVKERFQDLKISNFKI